MSKYYVYLYIKPDTFKPFYVGKGHKERWKHHIKLDNKYYNLHLKNTIKSLKQRNLKPIIIKVEKSLTNEEASILEKELIYLFGRKDLNTGILVNHTNGGDGSDGRICSQYTKNKMSKSQKGVSRNKGLKRPDLAKRNKKFKWFLGKKLPKSTEYREKIRQGLLGYKHNEKTILKHKLNSDKRERDKLGRYMKVKGD